MAPGVAPNVRRCVLSSWRAARPYEAAKLSQCHPLTCSLKSFVCPPRSVPALRFELIRSLDLEAEADAADAWDAEIARRGAVVEADTAETMTVDEYRAHVRQRRAARARR